MIKGYKKLKNVEPGSLIRLPWQTPTYALVSEYGAGSRDYPETYLAGSGEMLGIDPNTWVAIIDLDALDRELMDSEELEYPAEESKPDAQ